MQKKHSKSGFVMKWNRIPRVRRQFYVYALLLLSAIVGNNFNRAIADASDDVSNDRPSSYENLRDKTNLLYR